MTTPTQRAGAAVHIATAGPAGRVPWAPGTAGSLVGLGLTALIERVLLPHGGSRAAVAGLAAVIFLAGTWAAGKAERFFRITDPGAVVIDEVAGQMAVFLLRTPSSWVGYVAGFVLFRFFDVVKPFPARRAEHLPSGWGIMTDDLVAGAYGAVAWYLLGFLVR